MSRYKHFDDELCAADINEAAVLPELDVDEPHQLEFKPQLRNYSSSSNLPTKKFTFNYWKIYLSRRTRLERFLIFTFLFLSSLIFFLCLSVFSRHRDIKHPEELCLTPACIQVSAAIYSGMNQTINPCDDFYQFTCGRWIKTNIIPKGHSSWSTTKELSRKNLITLKSILEGTVDNSSSVVFNAEYEAIKFYQSCLNVTEIERRQLQPLKDFFQENFNFTIEQWINIDQNRTWHELFISLTRIISKKYGFSYLIPISIGPDDKNSTWNVLHVSAMDSRDSCHLLFYRMNR